MGGIYCCKEKFSIEYINKLKKFYKDIFQKGRNKGEVNTVKKRVRFITRTLFYLPQSLDIADYIMGHKYLSEEILRYPVLTSKVHRPYLCNLFGVNKRLKSIKETYDFIDTYFPLEIVEGLYRNGEVELVELKGSNEEIYKVYLQLYSNFDKEGELIFKILNSQEIPLSKVTFGVIKENEIDTLFIGGIQGPYRTVDKDCIKEATKGLAGLFPKRILFEAIYALENSLNKKLDKVCVGNTTHAYVSKRYEKKKTINANYDDFLMSLNAEEQSNGLWKLPSELVRKDILDVPSKKRSEYRKKYVILDDINTSISKKFGREI
ncbi:MAG: VirK/YbjX family protein [Fusobacteriaceae bacterium]